MDTQSYATLSYIYMLWACRPPHAQPSSLSHSLLSLCRDTTSRTTSLQYTTNTVY